MASTYQPELEPTDSPYEMVQEFHKVYGLAQDEEFTEENIRLRSRLIDEETEEVQDELFGPIPLESTVDKIKLTKELADLMYVTIGTAVAFGLPLEQVFAEVHKSNMSKLDENGKPIYREDGKVLKSVLYQPPNLEQFF